MSYDNPTWLNPPTNWWRTAAIVLGCIVVVAGVVLYGERSANREFTERIDELEGAVLLAGEENRQLGESLGEVQDRLGDSEDALGRARGIASDLAGVLDGLSDERTEIGRLIGELADQVRHDLAGDDTGGGSGGADRDP